jgi:hypothetical protein
METLCRLTVIRGLIDQLLSDNPTHCVQANLYTARIQVVQAIREQNAMPEVMNWQPFQEVLCEHTA